MRVRIRDISRMGIRLGFPPWKLGISSLLTLGELTRQLGRVLPEDLPIEIDPERLGHLLKRRLHVVRIRKWVPRTLDIELGCTFDRSLDDDEVAALGLPLPDRRKNTA